MKKIGIKLWVDDEAEGSIVQTPYFTQTHIVYQLDCLQDWLGDLTILYNSKMDEFREYGESVRKAQLEDREGN